MHNLFSFFEVLTLGRFGPSKRVNVFGLVLRYYDVWEVFKLRLMRLRRAWENLVSSSIMRTTEDAIKAIVRLDAKYTIFEQLVGRVSATE